jgi:hypothetical protein
MRHEDHCEKSMHLFGEDGAIFHKWIDQYAAVIGWNHRAILHHREGIEIGIRLFGEIARKHLEQHIKDDFGTEIIPTMKDQESPEEIFKW